MTQTSFITLKTFNNSLSYLISTNNDKYDINDSNVNKLNYDIFIYNIFNIFILENPIYSQI
jgi:hypothetical protein